MEELREYLENHKGFRLTKEMIDKIMGIADIIDSNAYDYGW